MFRNCCYDRQNEVNNTFNAENIDVDIDNCYDYSYIEQSILENIRGLNNNAEANDDREFYSIHDVFLQEYKFES